MTIDEIKDKYRHVLMGMMLDAFTTKATGAALSIQVRDLRSRCERLVDSIVRDAQASVQTPATPIKLAK